MADQVEVVVPQQVGLDGLAMVSEEAGEASYSPASAPCASPTMASASMIVPPAAM